MLDVLDTLIGYRVLYLAGFSGDRPLKGFYTCSTHYSVQRVKRTCNRTTFSVFGLLSVVLATHERARASRFSWQNPLAQCPLMLSSTWRTCRDAPEGASRATRPPTDARTRAQRISTRITCSGCPWLLRSAMSRPSTRTSPGSSSSRAAQWACPPLKGRAWRC